MNGLVLYLTEASLYLAAITLAYRWLFASLTYFQWMRGYLVAGVCLSLCLPLLPAPAFVSAWLREEATSPSIPLLFSWQDGLSLSGAASDAVAAQTTDWLALVVSGMLTVYALGVVVQTGRLSLRLRKIYRLIAQHPRRKVENYWTITLPYDGPAFSFLRYVFLSTNLTTLTADERRQVLAHEAVHVHQRHTYDRLFLEVASVVLWFNPLVYYLKNQLREVQEYLADQAVSESLDQPKNYAHLLVKLATARRGYSLATGFSDRQITRRIIKLSQSRSSPKRKLIFASIIPLITTVFLLSACLEEPANRERSDSQRDEIRTTSEEGVRIGTIRWQGNTVYDDKQLSEVLGLRSGDPYDSAILNQRLLFDPDQLTVSSLYMDRGHLYFSINIAQHERAEGVVDLTMDIYEGDIVKIGQLIVKGNGEVSRENILTRIPIKSGELFSRAELIASQRVIAEMGYFDPQQVGIYPIPHPEQGTVDIEFTLEPRTTP